MTTEKISYMKAHSIWAALEELGLDHNTALAAGVMTAEEIDQMETHSDTWEIKAEIRRAQADDDLDDEEDEDEDEDERDWTDDDCYDPENEEIEARWDDDSR